MTLRAGSSAFVFALVAIGAAFFIGDAVIRGAWDAVPGIAGPAVLVVWAAWLLLFRPSIRVQPDRAVVVNVGRITEVPWNRVVDVRRRLQLILELDDGKNVEAWGSPFVSKRLKEVDDRGLTALRTAWVNSPAGDAAVVRRVDVLALAIGAAAVIVTVVCLGVAR